MTILKNATSPLTIPTHDGSGQNVHPSVVDFKTEHGIDSWNGFRYWMAMTPYPNSQNAYEDPNIIASNDMINWEVPVGITNPIDDAVGGDTYNNDTDLIYDPDRDFLICYWRFIDRSNADSALHYDKVYNIKVYSDLTLSTKVECFINYFNNNGGEASALSPAIWRKSATEYYMYTCNTAYVHLWTSTDGDTFSRVGRCDITAFFASTYLGVGYRQWHLAVKPNQWENRLEFMISAFPANSTGDYLSQLDLIYAQVEMGDLQTFYAPLNELLLDSGAGTAWDNERIYRTAFTIERTKNDYFYHVWYSARQMPENVWNTGYTRGVLGTSFTGINEVKLVQNVNGVIKEINIFKNKDGVLNPQKVVTRY